MQFTKVQKKQIWEAFRGIDRKLLAETLNMKSRNQIDQIARGLKGVSLSRAIDIEIATSGKVKASILKPGIFREIKRKHITRSVTSKHQLTANLKTQKEPTNESSRDI